MRWKGMMLSFIVGLGMMALVILGYTPIHSPVLGLVISDVRGPIAVVSTNPGPKVGKAVSTTILGLVASGDSSIEAAARNGGITKIMTVNHDSRNILGLWTRFTTTVTGE
ncbi:MAG: TRL-like family protein [bacterium]|nr:TRL-like family protein [bacterium]